MPKQNRPADARSPNSRKTAPRDVHIQPVFHTRLDAAKFGRIVLRIARYPSDIAEAQKNQKEP